MEKPKRESPLRKHKGKIQASALAIMLGVPGLLYWAAQADAAGWTVTLLGLMAATMVLLALVR